MTRRIWAGIALVLAVVVVGSRVLALASATALSSTWGGGEDGDVTVPASVTYDITQDNHPGRSCSDGGDAVVYQVTGFTDTTATVASPPQPGCLAPGDEIMLIKLQGSYTNNVGVYEFLEVANVSGNTVAFTSAKTYTYGNAAGSDNGINSTERVALQRVPHYDALTVLGTLTAGYWDGDSGGVVVFRAHIVTGGGFIQMSGQGYRGGSGGADGDTAQQGESIGGMGADATSANIGGGGGGEPCCNGGGGGGYATYGGQGNEGPTGLSGAGGLTYGMTTLSKVFLGSGGGGGGDHYGTPGGNGGRGGGIVIAFAKAWNYDGAIQANGGSGQVVVGPGSRNPGDGGGGSGGSIRIQGEDVSIGTLQAVGGTQAAAGGVGRIAVYWVTHYDVQNVNPAPYTQRLPTPTPSPTATFTPSPTATFTPSPTATFTPSPTATFTPSPTATFVPSLTATFTPSPTATFTPSPTATFTPSPTVQIPTNTPTPTPSPFPTSTLTPTPSPTNTPDFWATATAVSLTATAWATPLPVTETPSPSDGGNSVPAASTPVPTPAPTPYSPYVPPAPYGHFTVVVRVFIDENGDNVMSLQESVSDIPVYAFDAMFHRIGAVLTQKGVATFQVPVMPGQMYYFDIPYLGLTAFVNSPRDTSATEPIFVDFRLKPFVQPVMLP